MRTHVWILPVALLMQTACNAAQPASGQDANADDAALTVDEATIFRAAGFEMNDGYWAKCGDPGTDSYEAGAIFDQGDFNRDGLPDAIVSEGSTFCYGMTGLGYTLVSQQPHGQWAILSEGPGIPQLLETTGTANWPDIEVGGPGFCFPVLRWNGTEYAVNRQQYRGQPCAE